MLFSMIMGDGSRLFGDMLQTVGWVSFSDHIGKLEGAEVTALVTDWVTEAWIDFTYAGHRFGVNTQMGEYWFFVDDPQCPDEILERVLLHCSQAAESM